MNDDSKPSLAAGMAKRSFWIAVAGSWTGILCRKAALGEPMRALLMLFTIALLLIATVFAAVALIRITSKDRGAVLLPGLVGLLLGLAGLANLSNAARDNWVQARARARQAEETRARTEETPSVPLRQRTEISSPRSSIQYSVPAIDQIPQAAAEIRTRVARSKGDDGAVLRAWAAHLEKLYAAYTNTHAASNKLHEVNLLDPKLISSFDQDEPVRRRRLANQYYDAWHKLGESLSTFSGSYYSDLYSESVSAERASVEVQALSSALERPETAARVAALRKLCAAEETVGLHYNYSVSAVFDYTQLASKVPNLPSSHRKEMDNQVAKLKEVAQAAADARREAFPAANGDSQQGQARAEP